MAKQVKRMAAVYEGIDRDKFYPLAEAVSLIKARTAQMPAVESEELCSETALPGSLGRLKSMSG